VRWEEVMKSKTARAYLDDYEALRSIAEFDALTTLEIMESIDAEGDDPFLNPWKRGYNAAIRAASGH
jgi:hypothetical protein